MTDMAVKFQLTDLAGNFWQVLEAYEETHSREEVIRAVGEAIAVYLLTCGLKDGSAYVPGGVFGNAMAEVTPRFASAYTEAFITIKGGRN